MRNCPRCATPGDYEIYAPLLALPQAQGSELVFNSRSPQAMEVTPIFYKLDGTRIMGDAVKIESAEIRYVDVRKLLPPRYRDDRDWGGLSLAYHGVAREMWAQLRFLSVNGGNNVDEFFIVKPETRSDVQEAVWWAPPKSTSIIALGNVTDAPTGATLTFGNGDVQTVQLAPNATQIVQRENSKDVESLAIHITGLPGSIIPTGVITTKDGSFNSVIRFYDTKTAKQPHLFANGLRLGGVTPHVVLKNTSDAPVVAQPAVISVAGVTAREPILLPAVSLAANEMREIDLSGIGNKQGFDVVSMRVNNSGAPGSLIGSIHAIQEQTGLSYDTPLRDTGPIRAMTGSYPWKISNDFTTIVYITNVSDQQAEFMGELNYRGGHVVVDPRKLQPGETAVFDMRKIRAEETKDGNGHHVPRDTTFGQFKWSVRGVTNGKHLLIGRAEMVSRSQRISTSYSCNDPCPPYYGGSIDPFPPPVVFVNTTGNAAMYETAYYDSGYTTGPYSASATWSLSAAISSLDPTWGGTTTMTGSTPGGAVLDGFVAIQQDYGWDGLNCYEYGTYEERDQGPTATKPTISGPTSVWWFNGLNPSNANMPISIQLTTQSGAGSYSWTATANANKVGLSNTTTNTVTVTSAAMSGQAGDVKIKVTVNGTASDEYAITVKAPNQLNRTNIQHTSSTNFGYRTEITYSIRDQFNSSLLAGSLPINEDFTGSAIADFTGMNWLITADGGATLNGPTVSDVIEGENLTKNPTPQAPQNPLGSTKVVHWGQDIYVGSTTVGQGKKVQTATFQKYRDHADHENVTSPVP